MPLHLNTFCLKELVLKRKVKIITKNNHDIFSNFHAENQLYKHVIIAVGSIRELEKFKRNAYALSYYR